MKSPVTSLLLRCSRRTHLRPSTFSPALPSNSTHQPRVRISRKDTDVSITGATSNDFTKPLITDHLNTEKGPSNEADIINNRSTDTEECGLPIYRRDNCLSDVIMTGATSIDSTKSLTTDHMKTDESPRNKVAAEITNTGSTGTRECGETSLRDKILKNIKDHGLNSSTINGYLHGVCSEARTVFRPSADLWVGYESSNENILVVVATVDKILEGVPNEILDCKLVQRQRYNVSKEAELCLKRERDLVTSTDKLLPLQACLAKHSPKLFQDHSNLKIISASKIKSRGYSITNEENIIVEETDCVVLYVHIKGIIPIGEKQFPRELDGFLVDVREGCFHTYMLPHVPSDTQEYQKNLTIGCQIASSYEKVGSIGGFVQLPNRSIGCLTCWHIFDTKESKSELSKELLNRAKFKRDVFQPYPYPQNDYKIGTVFKGSMTSGSETSIGVDAALIEITERHREPQNGQFPGSISLKDDGSSFDFCEGEVVKSFEEVAKCSNDKLVKYGAQTGLTTGYIHVIGASVNDTTPQHQQIEICPEKNYKNYPDKNGGKSSIAAEGDSGSLFLSVPENGDEDEIRAVGMLIGATTYGTVMVTPIWAILESFDLPLKLLSFNDQRIRNLTRGLRNVENKLSNVDRKIDLLLNQRAVLPNNS